jgi:hypothetical protein
MFIIKSSILHFIKFGSLYFINQLHGSILTRSRFGFKTWTILKFIYIYFMLLVAIKLTKYIQFFFNFAII